VVVLWGRRRDRLEETAASIREAGGQAEVMPRDITESEQVRAGVEKVLDTHGRIDLLFNNAGRFNCIGGVHEADPEDWWADVTVNLRGGFLMMRHVLPHMIERDAGIIINMSGGRPTGGTGYAASKAGLVQMTETAAAELQRLGSRVMVFIANPGFVQTEMSQLQADTEAGRFWMPHAQKAIREGTTRDPQQIADATMRLLTVARPEHSGSRYSHDTDFRDW